MRHVRGFATTALLLSVVIAGVSPVDAAPESQMTWAVHTALAGQVLSAPHEDVKLKSK